MGFQGHGLSGVSIFRSGGMAGRAEKGINGDMISIYDKGPHIPYWWTHLFPATIEGKSYSPT